MVKMSVLYTGKLHCKLEHEPSKSMIETDAPKDNHGLGEKFSPTDLVGAALGSCILTTMAIVAERDGVSLQGATASVEKEMVTDPARRIGALHVKIRMPKSVPADKRQKLEQVAMNCPVTKSVHPEMKIPMSFSYE